MRDENRVPHGFERLVPWLVGLLPLLTFLGCSAPQQGNSLPRPPIGGVLLHGAGATFPSPLYRQWLATYRNGHPETVITYDAVGSGEGIRRFVGKNVKKEEKVDFGASDAAMTDQEISEVSKGVLLLPATAGSVVLIYNLPEVARASTFRARLTPVSF
jgi:phosphate transport system substrate-binding protein